MRNAFERHLREPRARGPVPEGAAVGSAGGSACGDLVRIGLRADVGRVSEVTFDAEGCGATVAAASACVTLAEGRPLLEVARIGSEEVARELGGLTPGKRHAADLACDALHRALSKIWGETGPPLLELEAGRVLVAMGGGGDRAAAGRL